MNYAEFLDFVVQIISKNLNPQSEMMTGALLGELMQQAAPDVSWKKFGKRSLFAVLEDLEADGRIEVVKTDKGALAVRPTAGASKSSGRQLETYNPLRKAMWEAFVLVAPAGRRFIHQKNGTLRAGLEIAPAPADEWIEITPISSEMQKAWAADFLSRQALEQFTKARQLVDSQNWSAPSFAGLIKEESESVFREWNKYRSSLVSSEVQRWLLDSNLPVDWAFQRNDSRLETSSVERVTPGAVVTASEENTKAVILAALAQLPIDQLLLIPIPAGILLAALSAAKAS
ncbi:hypothetical protein [Pseudomonas fragi]|uniref:hypothetical protein n=1 Tax=Pseudomonas fragi TaxID=296 RepID=UPI000BA2394D|nr:hypothetical protein [Pseudomonas fragi]PAA16484.1 hypothetical protein CJU77_24080 [Pseudomonas fragi]